MEWKREDEKQSSARMWINRCYKRRLMHLVPAPAVRLMKRRVLSTPGLNSLMSLSCSCYEISLPSAAGWLAGKKHSSPTVLRLVLTVVNSLSSGGESFSLAVKRLMVSRNDSRLHGQPSFSRPSWFNRKKDHEKVGIICGPMV